MKVHQNEWMELRRSCKMSLLTLNTSFWYSWERSVCHNLNDNVTLAILTNWLWIRSHHRWTPNNHWGSGTVPAPWTSTWPRPNWSTCCMRSRASRGCGCTANPWGTWSTRSKTSCSSSSSLSSHGSSNRSTPCPSSIACVGRSWIRHVIVKITAIINTLTSGSSFSTF